MVQQLSAEEQASSIPQMLSACSVGGLILKGGMRRNKLFRGSQDKYAVDKLLQGLKG